MMMIHSATRDVSGHCGGYASAAARVVWLLIFLISRVAPGENDRDFRAHASLRADAGPAPEKSYCNRKEKKTKVVTFE